MLLKKIRAKTLAEAVEKTRVACGEDALLVETRKTSGGYVVVAARPPSPTPRVRVAGRKAARAGVRRWTRGFAPLAENARRFGISTTILRAVERALLGTRVRLDRAGDPALPGVAARVMGATIQTEPMALPDYKVTALVGPTGVGKTTTLAKLAASAVRDHDESVAIVTLDTYRVAAVEQLRAFAEMIGVPLEVAFTPVDLRRAIQRHAAADRILIDTSGRSPFDTKALEVLRATLEAVQPKCTLCLSAHARRLDGMATLAAFGRMSPASAVLTKWDETRAPGEALSLLVERGIPITHVTIGQEVPEDIVRADGATIATRAFETTSDDLL